MFNFWFIFFCTVLLLVVAVSIFIESPHQFLFISEFFLVTFILNFMFLASVTNDARFFLLAIMILFIAAIEIILYLIYTATK